MARGISQGFSHNEINLYKENPKIYPKCILEKQNGC